MPKQISHFELNPVLEAVTAFPEGASVQQISEQLGQSIPRRTLQRRLILLVEQKRLECNGQGSATRYRVAPTIYSHGGLVTGGTAEVVFYPPLSVQGQAIREAIMRPLQQRRPVGYNRAFVDSYRPNETFYLSAELRAQLLAMGASHQEQRPAGTFARQIVNRLLIDLSWNSSRLEGNTYSLLETQLLLEAGAIAEGKNALETQMLLNHKAAIELLVDQAEEVGFNRYTLLNLHALLSENLLADPGACGRLRTIPVGISGTVYHPLEVPQQIDDCFTQVLNSAAAIRDPFEQAFFAMVHLPYLQPFEDVNKRVSRLAANIPLIRHNLSPLSFVDLSEQIYVDAIMGVYELNRIELLRDVFVWAYERSCARYSAVRQSLGQPDPFRLKHKMQISELVSKIVKEGKNKSQAAQLVRNEAKERVTDDEYARFV
ncbi:MAG TPA: Fic family protein, partial [Cellvibrio sp.]|nr:Fic family protein [Cellvibrio sp.]